MKFKFEGFGSKPKKNYSEIIDESVGFKQLSLFVKIPIMIFYLQIILIIFSLFGFIFFTNW